MRLFASTLVLGLFLCWAVDGARQVSAQDRAKRTMAQASRLAGTGGLRNRRDTTSHPRTARDLMGIEGQETFLPVGQARTAQGTIQWKFREQFRGMEILDSSLTAETDRDGEFTGDARGTIYEDIESDIPSTQTKISKYHAFLICLRRSGLSEYRDLVDDYVADLVIYMDRRNRARLTYYVQFLIESKEVLRRPTCLIDARNRRLFRAWDSLETTKWRQVNGVGGNRKMGQVLYGEAHRILKAKQIGNTCYLENDYVRVVNMNFTYDEGISDTVSFPCNEVYNDSYDGSYSAALDAFYNANGVYHMFSDWFDIQPFELPIVLRVHYGEQLESAYWNGANCTFGDGKERFFALTATDVMAHELAHSITEKHSKLFYFNQPGALDESFSDISGEVAEAYVTGNDWLIGKDIMRKVFSFRYFQDPTADNLSISHIDDFVNDMNVHFASGVINKAFYELVNTQDMSLRDAYNIFLMANRIYWYHMTTFEMAACDVMKSAYDLGLDFKLVEKAFATVGIPGCDIAKHVLTLRKEWQQDGFVVSHSSSPMFAVNVPDWVFELNITVGSGGREVLIIASNGSWPTLDEHTWESDWKGQSAIMIITEPPEGRLYLKLITTLDTEIKDGTLFMSYICGEGDMMNGAYFLDCLFDEDEFF